MQSMLSKWLLSFVLASVAVVAPPLKDDPSMSGALPNESERLPHSIHDELQRRSLGVTRTALHPRMYGCDNNQKDILKSTWQQAGAVAKAHTLWAGGKPPYQVAMDYYLGTDSGKEGDPKISTAPLKQNVKRQYGLHKHNQFWSPYWAYAYFYCDEDKLPHKPSKPAPLCELGYEYYTFTDPASSKLGWDSYYTVFCNSFFHSMHEEDLDDVIQEHKDDKELSEDIEDFWYTRARLMLEASYTWEGVLIPYARDVTPDVPKRFPMTPWQIVSLAKERNTEFVKRYPQAWALAALGIYVMQELNLQSPPEASPGITENADLPTNGTQGLSVERVPNWFAPPFSSNSDAAQGPDLLTGDALEDPGSDDHDPAAFAVPDGGPGEAPGPAPDTIQTS